MVTGQQVNVAYIPTTDEAVKFFADIAVVKLLYNKLPNSIIILIVTILSSRRGQFTERNAARTPWNTDLDFRLLRI